MTGAESVTYRYLERTQLRESSFQSLRAAFDQACEDLEQAAAAPVEIARGPDIVMSSYEIYDLCDLYVSWKEGRTSHPLGSD